MSKIKSIELLLLLFISITLDNNDLNQVVRPAVLVKTRIWLRAQSRMLKKTWSRSLLLKDF